MKRLMHLLAMTGMLCMSLLVPAAPIAHAAIEPISPNLQITIPGLTEEDFRGSVVVGSAENDNECSEGKVCIGTISVYLNAVYRFLVTAGVIFSIVIIMIGGVEYMVGSASGQIEKARKHIIGAVVGLAILLGVTSILTFVNPNISGLRSLELTVLENIPTIPPDDFGASFTRPLQNQQGETFQGSTPLKNASGDLLTDNITTGQGSDNTLVHNDIVVPLQTVASQLNGEYTGARRLEIVKTYVDTGKHVAQFFDNCIDNNCAEDPICNPFPPNEVVEGSYSDGFRLTSAMRENLSGLNREETIAVLAQEARNSSETSCPFLTGYAVIALCEGDTFYRANINCQTRLETLMQEQGFCRSVTQPWIYEFRGKQTLESTRGCDAIPGIMLVSESDDDSLCDTNATTFEYNSVQSGLCASSYSRCSNTFPKVIDLTNGRCTGTTLDISL